MAKPQHIHEDIDSHLRRTSSLSFRAELASEDSACLQSFRNNRSFFVAAAQYDDDAMQAWRDACIRGGESGTKRGREEAFPEGEDDEFAHLFEDNGPSSKRQAVAGAGEPDKDDQYNNLTAEERAHVQKVLDEADENEVKELNADRLRQLLVSLERKITKNQRLRVKYANDPVKYMDSEVELNEEIQQLQVVATAPHLYGILVSEGTVDSLLGLLSHENADIAAHVLECLAELTESDVLEEVEDDVPIRQFITTLLEPSRLHTIVQRMTVFDETDDDEAQGVHHALSVVENLLEAEETAGSALWTHTRLFSWLLRRVQKKEYDGNKLYASEILSMLLHSGTASFRTGLLDVEGQHGLDTLLVSVAPFRKRDAGSKDEQECVQNLFDCICAALLEEGNRSAFRELDGFDLMLRMFHGKRFTRHAAVRVMRFAVADTPANCEALVEAGGLGALFPVFMGKGSAATRKQVGADAAQGEQENVITILATLLAELDRNGIAHLRVLRKFLETAERTDRLVELHVKFAKRVAEADEEGPGSGNDDEDGLEERLGLSKEERSYFRRLDAGLFPLQRVDLIIARLCERDERCRARILHKMHEQNVPLAGLTFVLRETAQYVVVPTGEDGSEVTEGSEVDERRELHRLAGFIETLDQPSPSAGS